MSQFDIQAPGAFPTVDLSAVHRADRLSRQHALTRLNVNPAQPRQESKKSEAVFNDYYTPVPAKRPRINHFAVMRGQDRGVGAGVKGDSLGGQTKRIGLAKSPGQTANNRKG